MWVCGVQREFGVEGAECGATKNMEQHVMDELVHGRSEHEGEQRVRLEGEKEAGGETEEELTEGVLEESIVLGEANVAGNRDPRRWSSWASWRKPMCAKLPGSIPCA